jgi:hypothetical protein
VRTKKDSIRHEFVEFIPDDLEEGVVYVALEYGAVVHLCCDGCGEKVSTPLHPAQWKLIFDGESISLRPSVGSSGLACNSHYVIERGRVQWCRPLTRRQAERDHERDVEAVGDHFDPEPAPALPRTPETRSDPRLRPPWWRRLLRRR